MGAKSETRSTAEKIIRGEKDSILKAIVDVVPNEAFRAKEYYQLDGLGIYSGKYYANKVTHVINQAGYSVTIEATAKDVPGLDIGSSGGTGTGDSDSSEGNVNNTSPSREPVHVTVVDEATGLQSDEFR